MLENRISYHPPESSASSTGETTASSVIPNTMRALVLEGTGFEHLKIQEVPVPRPGPRQMLARVDAAGICTSNIKLVQQGPNHSMLYGWDITKHPLILGDEGPGQGDHGV